VDPSAAKTLAHYHRFSQEGGCAAVRKRQPAIKIKKKKGTYKREEPETLAASGIISGGVKKKLVPGRGGELYELTEKKKRPRRLISGGALPCSL